MYINRPIALSAVICNVLYTIICITRFFYLHNQIIIDFSKGAPVEVAPNSLWLVFPQILYLCIFTALIWVLKICYEKLWIIVGTTAFLIIKVITVVILHSINNHILITYDFIFDILSIANLFLLIYLVVSYFLIQNKYIRPYFRWLAILLVLSLLLPRLGEILYDDLSIHWLLINPDVMSELCFIPTLILFIKIYRRSLQMI